MIRTYRYRLYPTEAQQSLLGEILRLACWLYNRALDYRRKRWHESRISVTYNEQATLWRDWRNEEPADNPLRLLNLSAGQQVLRRLDSAYRQFLKGARGRPRFQRASHFNSVNYKPGDGAQVHYSPSDDSADSDDSDDSAGASVKPNRLYVQNVGLIRVRGHRPVPAGVLKNIVIVRKPSGWYALLQYELPEPQPAKSSAPPAGIDVGITHALALSDGTRVDSPRPLQRSRRKLRVLQRAVARKPQGSANRRKAVARLARLHEQIDNQRRDFWHKVTHQLVSTYGALVLEELPLGFMLRSDTLALAAHDIGLGMFRELLDYKAIQAGVEVVAVNPRNTSQWCSGCGCVVPKPLRVRVHVCPECGLTLDRDVNAARNILALGCRAWALTWPVGACVAQEAPPL